MSDNPQNQLQDDSGTSAMPLLDECPLEPSKFLTLLRSQPLMVTLEAIEKHVSSSSLCHHPPLKDIIFGGQLEGTTPLLIFCGFGMLSCVKRMVETWGVDVEAPAVYYFINLLCGRSEKVGIATPLYAAAHGRCFETVKYLVEQNAVVSSRISSETWTNDGEMVVVRQTPLQGTLDNYRIPASWPLAIPIAVYLLESGADPNTLDKYGSPLWALLPWNADIIAGLIHRGLNLDLRDQSRQTLLHIACQIPDLPIIQLLFQKGADPNAVDENGNAPLHVLASMHQGDGQVIASAARLLLENGADLDHVNQEGKTAAQVWEEKNVLQHLPNWLLEAGMAKLDT